MRHAASIFLSAFLLFQVQLILGKYLLPWFGGAPAVWTTCILFFQCLLLGGYAYAFFIDQHLSVRRQALVHGLLLLMALGVLLLGWVFWGKPLLPGDGFKPEAGTQHPILQVLIVLLVAVALPYLLLAANSPLIQRWQGLASGGRQPYRLYAVSNTGSLLGLVSYPFLVEPTLPLSQQALLWGAGYLLFAVLTVSCLWQLGKLETVGVEKQTARGSEGGPTPRRSWLFWLILAACPSCMFLAVTNDLSQEVAVTPFIWVLPLVIYLITFILCFDHPRWYSRRFFILLTYGSSIAVLITNLKGLELGIIEHVLAQGLFLFAFCMLCHGELYRLRPGVERLTRYFLVIALGGVSGGVLIGIIAPVFFTGYWEFHLTILFSWCLLTYLFWKDKGSFLHTGAAAHAWGLLVLLSYVALHYTFAFSGVYQIGWIAPIKEWVNLAAGLGAGSLLYFGFRGQLAIHSPYWPRILIASIIFIAECFAIYRVRSSGYETLTSERNFFGVVKVADRSVPGLPVIATRNLIHGKILHGFQFLRSDLETQPTAYYVDNSGIGFALDYHPRRNMAQPLHVGVTGLGSGAIATQMRWGDTLRFYEINPIVVDYAMGPEAYFSFLEKSPADVEVALGDARLVLEAELATGGGQDFDVLVLDAFSSDAVPVHLLTAEAFQIYEQHLRDEESIIAVNISNRFLDLRAPVFTIAEKLGMRAAVLPSEGEGIAPVPSVWILMSRGAFLDEERIRDWVGFPEDLTPLEWTDDFTNLWKVLRQK
jgi:hypothetical protein